MADVVWRLDKSGKAQGPGPKPETPNSDIFRPDILDWIDKTIQDVSEDLRGLSLDIHDQPELKYEEKYAHDALTKFIGARGFAVEKHYLLPTAWRARFSHGRGGRVIGVNSEMDALAGVGHACGHNLIAIAGVAVACAIKSALEHFNMSGKVELLGTPAEEGGYGKVKLMEKGAYKEMDICLMCHPAPGPIGSVSLSSSLALKTIDAEYYGHAAHAALSPWEGVNALDAAVLAYNNVSAMRQQLKPTYRVHGIIQGKDWSVNVIPEYAKYQGLVRAPTRAELELAQKKVQPCFEGAGHASGCRHELEFGEAISDIRQNKALGDEVARVIRSRYGTIDHEWGIKSASTDFGNVTYELPSLHPGFAIPTYKDGGNHTPAFTKAARTLEAHQACLDVSKALAATGVRVVLDNDFFNEVKTTFEEDKKIRDVIV